jgi:hypothetical protein
VETLQEYVPEAMLEKLMVLEVEDPVCPASVTPHDLPDGRPDSVNVTVYVEGDGGEGEGDGAGLVPTAILVPARSATGMSPQT